MKHLEVRQKYSAAGRIFNYLSLLINYDGPGVGHLTQSIALSSNPWPLPGLPPPSRITLIGAYCYRIISFDRS